MYTPHELLRLTPEEVLDYLRKSRSDDPLLAVEDVLAKHETILDEWAEKNLGGKVPEENKYREVVSGETIEDRPQMKELLNRIESPRIKAVLVVEVQRLSRGDLEDAGRLIKLLRYTNTLVITPNKTYNLQDEYDRDIFERELKRGNEYLEYQKKIMGRGRLLSVQQGNYIGSKPPYGYDKCMVMDGKRKCPTLEPNPDEAPVVKLIFDLYCKGYGSTRIGNHLVSLGVKPPQGNKYWHRRVIDTILCNEHYLGKVRWNHKKAVKSVKSGEILKQRKVAEDYLLFPGKHPAIIDQETFDEVQRKRGQLPRYKPLTTFRNPLAGILYCSCGSAMEYRTYKSKGVAWAAPRYQCSRARYCENSSCKVDEVLAEVKSVLSEAVADFEMRLEAGEDHAVELNRQLVERLERRLSDLESLEIKQWDKYTQEGMPKHIFDKLNEKVRSEITEVEEALCVAKNSIPEPVDFQEKASTFRDVLEMMDDPAAPTRELNALLKNCIKKITYRRPKAKGEKSRWATGNPIELDIELKV